MIQMIVKRSRWKICTHYLLVLVNVDIAAIALAQHDRDSHNRTTPAAVLFSSRSFSYFDQSLIFAYPSTSRKSRQPIVTESAMKSLRRSLNHEKNSSSPQPSPPLPISYSGNSHALGRPSEKVAPPQKVIKALSSHQSTNPQELSYNKGDFWYVTGERDAWFEALSKS